MTQISTTGSDETVDGYHSPDTERLLIGVLLTEAHGPEHHHLMSLLAPEDFFIEEHQHIWRACGHLSDAGRPHDPSSVVDAADRMGVFIGGTAYIVGLISDPLVASVGQKAIHSAAQRIKSFSLTRQLQTTLERALTLARAGQDFDVVAGYVDDDLSNLRKRGGSSRTGPQHIANYYVKVTDRLVAQLEGVANADLIPTGFQALDESLGGGLTRGLLVVLAARPGMGKTAFADNIEDNISRRGVPTCTFSLEMPATALAQRKIARRSRISFTNLKQAKLSEHDLSAVIESIDTLKDAPCYLDDTPGLTIRDIRARARAFCQAHPGGVIFVDYLQKIAASKEGRDPRHVVGESSEGLLNLARELNVPVMGLAQLNRGLESRTNKRPIMSDLRESGQIEQDAAVILFLYRDEYYNPNTNEPGVTEVICAKNRDGAVSVVKFTSQMATMSYQEIGAAEYAE